MNTFEKPRTWRSCLFTVLLLSGMIASCATTHHYVNKNIPNAAELCDSPAHRFQYVDVTDDDISSMMSMMTG